MPEELRCFGRNLRHMRETQGFSQEKLAALTGLHRTYIGGLERGERNVGLLNMLKLARALGVQPGQLFEGIE